MNTTLAYPTHPIGVGIDVGKKEMVACTRRSQSALAEPAISIPNTTTGIRDLLRHLDKTAIPQDAPILLESTGPYHWDAAYLITQAGRNARVVNPLHTRQALRYSIRKRKTDKVDAAHLAMLAYQGYGYPFRDTHELAELKALVRHYWYLKYQNTNHARHERYLKEFRGIQGFTVSRSLSRQVDALAPEILSRFKGNDLRYLDSIPGVSPILAATILAELYPLSRFTEAEQLIAVAGLDPCVKQSGGKQARFGKLSKRGSPLLRHALYCAGFGAFTRAPWNTFYHHYKDRGLHHTAVLCIISRKMLRIIWALLQKRQLFDAKYLAVDN